MNIFKLFNLSSFIDKVSFVPVVVYAQHMPVRKFQNSLVSEFSECDMPGDPGFYNMVVHSTQAYGISNISHMPCPILLSNQILECLNKLRKKWVL